MSIFFSIINFIFFLGTVVFISYLKYKKINFSFQSIIALFLGIVGGIFFYYVHNNYTQNNLSGFLLELYRVISEIYINLLQCMVFPLIVVSILVSFTKVNNLKELGKYGLLIITFLLVGVGISSIISIAVMYLYGITKDITLPLNTLNNLSHYTSNLPHNIGDVIINFFPFNPFLDLTGARKSSTIAIVIFSILLGIGYLTSKKQYLREANIFKALINSLYIIIIKTLSIIISITPYAIFALIMKVIVTTSLDSILTIFNFIICIIISILLIFILQLILIFLFGFNPITYLKKTFTLLSFAFFARSSSASIPLGIYTQTQKLGINSTIANFSTTLGSVIGQAGCVGVYVTMLVFLTGAASGENIWNFSYIIFTLFIIIVTSIGIGGIGGGAVYGAIVALSILNYPLTILGFIIPAEAIIDMFRTALNVNSLTISGLLTSKLTKHNNKDIYNFNPKSRM